MQKIEEKLGLSKTFSKDIYDYSTDGMNIQEQLYYIQSKTSLKDFYFHTKKDLSEFITGCKLSCSGFIQAKLTSLYLETPNEIVNTVQKTVMFLYNKFCEIKRREIASMFPTITDIEEFCEIISRKLCFRYEDQILNLATKEDVETIGNSLHIGSEGFADSCSRKIFNFFFGSVTENLTNWEGTMDSLADHVIFFAFNPIFKGKPLPELLPNDKPRPITSKSTVSSLKEEIDRHGRKKDEIKEKLKKFKDFIDEKKPPFEELIGTNEDIEEFKEMIESYKPKPLITEKGNLMEDLSKKIIELGFKFDSSVYWLDSEMIYSTGIKTSDGKFWANGNLKSKSIASDAKIKMYGFRNGSLSEVQILGFIDVTGKYKEHEIPFRKLSNLSSLEYLKNEELIQIIKSEREERKKLEMKIDQLSNTLEKLVKEISEKKESKSDVLPPKPEIPSKSDILPPKPDLSNPFKKK